MAPKKLLIGGYLRLCTLAGEAEGRKGKVRDRARESWREVVQGEKKEKGAVIHTASNGPTLGNGSEKGQTLDDRHGKKKSVQATFKHGSHKTCTPEHRYRC